MSPPRQVTELLREWNDGDPQALEQLMPLVEAELRRVARAYMARERREHTLQPTALVNEAFLRLTDAQRIRWRSACCHKTPSARSAWSANPLPLRYETRQRRRLAVKSEKTLFWSTPFVAYQARFEGLEVAEPASPFYRGGNGE